MADEDYEFANAAPWEMAGRARTKKALAPAPRLTPATISRPSQHIRDHLKNQLVTLASTTAASTVKDEFRPAPTVTGAPPPGYTLDTGFTAPAGPQTTSGAANITVNEANVSS